MRKTAGGYVLLEQGEPHTYGDARFANRVADDALVVITSIRPELVADAHTRRTLATRRSALQRVRHPALVPVRDLTVGESEVAIVHDAPRGPSLRSVIDGSGTLSPYEAAALVGGVLRGLQVLHEHHLTHGDLRSLTVFPTGPHPSDVQLSDYGLADLLGAPPDADGAPEVRAGAAPTPASDVFAAGVLLYEALIGRRPPRPGETEGPDVKACADAGLLAFSAAMRADDPGCRPSVADAIDRLAFLGNQAPDPTVRMRVPASARYRLRMAYEASQNGAGIADADERATGEQAPSGDADGSAATPALRRGRPALPPAPVETAPMIEAEAAAPPAAAAPARRFGARARAAVAIALASAVLVGAWAATRGAGSVQPFQPATYAFDAQLFPDTGLVVTRSYTIEDRKATRLRADLRLTNVEPGPLTSGWDEVIPKSVAASSKDVRFLPLPVAVVAQDPVVRFAVTDLATNHARRFLYDAKPASGQADLANRLAALGNDQRNEERAYFVANGITEQPVGLERLELGVGEDAITLGLRKAHLVQVGARLADGHDSVAPSAMLQNLAWRSDHPEIVSVDSDGQLLGQRVGTAEITVSSASVSARTVVTVVADGPGDAAGTRRQGGVVIDDDPVPAPPSTAAAPGTTTATVPGTLPTTTLPGAPPVATTSTTSTTAEPRRPLIPATPPPGSSDPGGSTGGTLPPTALPTPTTLAPTTTAPATRPPTTRPPARTTTTPPTTHRPTTVPPTTLPPTTIPPTTVPPTTIPPTTTPPTTIPPTTVPPTTVPTTTVPTTTEPPTTEPPTTEPPTTEPPTTEPPTTEPPTTDTTIP